MDKELKKVLSLHIKSLGELPGLARTLWDNAGDKSVWVFEGEMAAGKTTLINMLCEVRDVVDTTSSPSYSIVQEYQNKKGENFFHFDFYRIEKESEAMDIGVDEYFYSGDSCFIEWPEKIPSLLPDDYAKVVIRILEDETRMVDLFKYE